MNSKVQTSHKGTFLPRHLKSSQLFLYWVNDCSVVVQFLGFLYVGAGPCMPACIYIVLVLCLMWGGAEFFGFEGDLVVLYAVIWPSLFDIALYDISDVRY